MRIQKATIFALALERGTLAQLVEQRTENPCVPGSIPGGTTFNPKSFWGFIFRKILMFFLDI